MAKKNIIQSIVIGIVLTTLSYLVAWKAGWVDTVNPLEAFAVLTSYASTYLCVVERRFNYVFGAVSTAAYSVLFFQYGLIASAVLNAYLAPSLLYGWFRWGKDSSTRKITHVQLKWVPVYLAITAVAYFGGTVIVHALGGQFATWDVVILVGSILAQFLLDNKKIENWAVWAVVNMAAIYVYFSSGLPLAGFQYIFFLANTVFGFVMWHKSMQRAKDETAGVLPEQPSAQATDTWNKPWKETNATSSPA